MGARGKEFGILERERKRKSEREREIGAEVRKRESKPLTHIWQLYAKSRRNENASKTKKGEKSVWLFKASHIVSRSSVQFSKPSQLQQVLFSTAVGVDMRLKTRLCSLVLLFFALCYSRQIPDQKLKGDLGQISSLENLNSSSDIGTEGNLLHHEKSPKTILNRLPVL